MGISSVGVAGAALSRSSPSSDMANVIVNKRMLELERENARLEGEIEILGKEKQALGEKLKRAEAQTEILQKAKVSVNYSTIIRRLEPRLFVRKWMRNISKQLLCRRAFQYHCRKVLSMKGCMETVG